MTHKKNRTHERPEILRLSKQLLASQANLKYMNLGNMLRVIQGAISCNVYVCNVTLAAIFYQFGVFMLFVLGSVTSWRSAAGIVAVIPPVTMLLLSRVSDDRIQYTIMPSEMLTIYILELLPRREI